MTNNTMELTKLTKLFDMTKMNFCAPKGEKMFNYGDYADKDIQSAIEKVVREYNQDVEIDEDLENC